MESISSVNASYIPDPYQSAHDNPLTIDSLPGEFHGEARVDISPVVSRIDGPAVAEAKESVVLAGKGRHRVPAAELGDLQEEADAFANRFGNIASRTR